LLRCLFWRARRTDIPGFIDITSRAAAASAGCAPSTDLTLSHRNPNREALSILKTGWNPACSIEFAPTLVIEAIHSLPIASSRPLATTDVTIERNTPFRRCGSRVTQFQM